VNRTLRRVITSLPGLNRGFYWARKQYHELRTMRAAKQYFVNYDRYVDALRAKSDGTVDIQTADGLTITIRRNQRDARILQEIFLSKPYDQDLNIPAGATVVDIGGYIGDFALYAARCLNARRVVVYEPSRKNFELLRRNIANNHLDSRVVAVNMAVGDSDVAMMNIDAPDTNQVNVSAYGHRDGAELAPVASRTLSGLIETHELDSIDLLKLDCEGGEYSILLSTPPETLQKAQHIVFEWHSIEGSAELLKAVQAKLVAAGYTLIHRPGDIISASRASA
jgi:FkbM family methyltransferase